MQLGIGKNVAAIVDREMKNVYHIEEGNRELVTIIEAISVDGAALPPSVIFQGKHHNLEWGRNNLCGARCTNSRLFSKLCTPLTTKLLLPMATPQYFTVRWKSRGH